MHPNTLYQRMYAKQFTEHDANRIKAAVRGYVHIVVEPIGSARGIGVPLRDVEEWLAETYALRDGRGYKLIRPIMDTRVWAFRDPDIAFAFRMRWT